MTRIRVFIKIPSDDAFELKAQALNNDPRLKAAGISALKFVDDKQYIADGEFSPETPPEIASEPISSPQEAPVESSSDLAVGGRLRIFVRVLSDDAYELKAQALNNDPRLKAAGISALKFESDKQYLVDGEFSPGVPPQHAPDESKSQKSERVRVYLRVPREDAYDLISKYLNGDPRLEDAGISDISLVKGGGVAAVSQQPLPESVPAPAAKQKPGPRRGCLVWGVILGVLAILIGVGVVFGAPLFIAPPTATASPTATLAATDTLVPTPTVTATHTPTAVIATKTPVPLKTNTPTLEPIVSCVAPEQGTILQQLNCRWGPGAVYIYRDGAFLGEQVQIIGRSDTAYGTWIYIQLPRPGQVRPVQCWINSDPRYSDYQGDVSCLESYYPEKAPPIPFSHPNFPPPSDVTADRTGDQVSIFWTVQILAAGDRPDEGQPPYAPTYLVETWTCQGGKIVFTPQGYYVDITETDPFLASIVVKDEAGCSEPSHGRVFLAHKDGYVGPVPIPWPP